jgi:hypothetical protein
MKRLLIFISVSIIATNIIAQNIEKKGFIGISIGPAIPLGSFASKSLTDSKAGFAKTGYSDSFINFGYNFNKKFGISASIFYNEHNVDKNVTEDWWKISGVTAGPMFSLPLSERFIFDIKTKIGLMGTSLIVDTYENQENIGSGIGIDIRSALRYNLARRWCIFTEAGLVHSNQKMGDGRKEKIQFILTGFGLGFRI